MSYLTKLMIPGETVVHSARRSVVATFGALLAFLILVLIGVGVAYAWSAPAAGLLGTTMLLVVALVLGVLLLARYVWWRNKVYVVTNLRVLKLEGLLSKAHRDASLDKINDLVLTQSMWGRLLGYGDVQISGNVSTQNLFRIQGGSQTFTAFDPVQERNTFRLQYEHELVKRGALLNGAATLPFVEKVDLFAYYRFVYDSIYDIAPGGFLRTVVDAHTANRENPGDGEKPRSPVRAGRLAEYSFRAGSRHDGRRPNPHRRRIVSAS